MVGGRGFGHRSRGLASPGVVWCGHFDPLCLWSVYVDSTLRTLCADEAILPSCRYVLSNVFTLLPACSPHRRVQAARAQEAARQADLAARGERYLLWQVNQRGTQPSFPSPSPLVRRAVAIFQ